MYLKHSHITSLYGVFSDIDYIYLILEYLHDGTLVPVVKKKKMMTEEKTSRIIHQVCKSLKYMHSEDIIHRDIKP